MNITPTAAVLASGTGEKPEAIWNAAWVMAQLAPVTPLVLTLISIAVLWKWKKIALTDVAVIIVTVIAVLLIPVLDNVITEQTAQKILDGISNL
jgi:C4-dicarboxylate transporter